MSIPPTTWPDAPGIIGLVIVGFGHDQSATLLHRLVVALGLVPSDLAPKCAKTTKVGAS
jgi:hypothetical protein